MTGEQWMAERLKEFTLRAGAGQQMTPEKAAALRELVGDELFSQVVTKAARPPTFHDFMGAFSDYLVARRGSQCL